MNYSIWTKKASTVGILLMMFFSCITHAQHGIEVQLTTSPEPFGCMKDDPQPQLITFTPESPITDLTDYSTELMCQATPFWDDDFTLASSSIVDVSAGSDGTEIQSSTDLSAMVAGASSNYLYYCELWLSRQLTGGGAVSSPVGTLYFDGLDDGTSATLPQFNLNPTNPTTTTGSVTISGFADGLDTVHINGESHPIIYNIPSRGAELVSRGGSFHYEWSFEATGLNPGVNSIDVSTTDCHGRTSTISNVQVEYIVPQQPATVSQLSGSTDVSGRSLTFDWSGYDVNGQTPPVTNFQLWKSSNPFTSTSDGGVEFLTSVGSGTSQYVINNLSANETVYVGIIASNGADSDLFVASATTVDTLAPVDASNLLVIPKVNDVRIEWVASEDYPDDVDQYKIYLNNTEVGTALANSWSHELVATTLQPTDVIKVTTVDASGNESNGVEFTGYSYPVNPSPLTFLSSNERVMIDWSSVQGVNGHTVTGYFVYVSDSPFANINDAGVTREFPDSVTPETPSIYDTAGVTKHFAVTTENSSGFEVPYVQSEAYTFEDQLAPPNPSNVTADSTTADSFRLTWTASSAPDLAGYQVSIENQDGPVSLTDLPLETLEFTATGLDPCREYEVQVRAVDTSNNASDPGFNIAFTQCPVVTGLVATPQIDQMGLSWDAINLGWGGEGINYDVYMANSPFTDVSQMTPVISDLYMTTTATITNLNEGQLYHFAVTARHAGDEEVSFNQYNISLNPAVTSLAERTLYNNQPPTINSVQFVGATSSFQLGTSPTVNQITESGTITVNVTDDVSPARVEFSLTNGLLNAIDGNGGENYSAYWDINAEQDGADTLTIKAFDTVNNEVTMTFDVNIALAPPAAPTISQPVNGSSIGDLQTTVVIQSVPNVTIDLEVNGTLQTGLAVDQNGAFQQLVSLQDGANTIRARAVNSRDTASGFTTVNVTVDQDIPVAPAGLNAQAQAQGVIRLTWNPDTDGTAVAYHVYRASSPSGTFEIVTNGGPVTGTSFDDMLLVDGEYFYQISGVSAADVEGPRSAVVSATADNTPPSGSLVYDPVETTYGSGQVSLTLTMSEPLSSTPFLSFVPQQPGISPIVIDLAPVSSTEFTGTLELGGQSIDATASAVMTAYDEANNLGTVLTSGQAIDIDTRGPNMMTLTVTPESPISYSNGQSLTVDFTLSEAPAGTPQLWYQLAGGPQRDEVEITSVNGSGTSWNATFTLPNGAGSIEAETLSFRFLAVDATGNPNGEIALNNQFQIYQNNLPPLEAPQGLAAESLPGGQVRLTWFPVLNAYQYELYRKPVGSGVLTDIGRVLAAEEEFFDIPSSDGEYIYAVASVRSENGDEAVSGTSLTVIATSDRIAPSAPQGLVLEETGSGIQAQWMPNDVADGVQHYRLYRNASLLLDQLNPNNLVDGLVTTIDSQPVQGINDYLVTAVDAVGNESAGSNSAQITPGLLPVHDFQINLDVGMSPALSWSHNTATEFDVYHINNGNAVNLSGTTPIMQTTFVDSTYTNTGRIYAVVAIEGSESLPNTLKLPDLSAGLMVEQSIKRGLINELFMEITNHEAEVIDHVSLTMTVNGQDYHSNEVSIPAQGSTEVSLVIPGDLPPGVDSIDAPLTIHHRPHPGSSANISSQLTIPVEAGGLIISVTTDNFVRGTTGEVQLLIQNPGEQSVDLITALGTGSQDSDDVDLRLEDQDGNILSVAGFRQVLGNNVFTFPGGVTVARIPAGESYLSSPQPIDIPVSASDHVVVVASIAQMYNDYGSGQPVTLQGAETRHPTVLTNTSYYGELVSISNDLIVDGGSTDITGRAVSRDSGQPVADVPLNLSLRNEGFEQNIAVFTDTNGQFVYTYEPSSTEAGVYQVSVTHPDILDRPMDGSFQVGRIYTAFQEDDVRIPFSVDTEHVLYVKAPRGLSYQNVRVEVESITPGSATVDASDVIATLDHQMGWQALNVVLNVPGSGSQTGQLIVKVFAENAGSLELGRATLNFEAADGVPDLRAEPQYIYTATNPGVTVTDIFELSNQGFADALNLSMQIVELDENGAVIGNAPNWISIVSNAQIENLGIYEVQEVTVGINPPASMDETLLNYRIRVTGDNIAGHFDVPLIVLVTLSDTGSIEFQTANVYTDPDANTDWLDGVRIKLTSEIDPNAVHVGYTDAEGRLLFTDVTAGRYLYHASKANHEDLTGRIRIMPDYIDPVTSELQSQYEFLFLNRNFITIDWSVTEITIEDRYEVVMNATFETNVPAPVVMMTPTVTNLPDMYPGDVYTGLMEIKNVGLLRAYDFALSVPPEDEYFIYEILGEVPEVIEANQSFFLPFKLINKQTLVPGADGGAGGGGCHGYSNQFNGAYKFQCPSGEIDGSASPSFVSYTAGSDCGGGGGQRNNPPRNSRDGGPLDFRCWQEDAALWCGGPGVAEESVQCAPECEGDQCCNNSGN